MRSAMKPRPAHMRLVTAREPELTEPPAAPDPNDIDGLYRAYAPYVAAIAVRIATRSCCRRPWCWN